MLDRMNHMNIKKWNITLIILIFILFCGVFLRMKGLTFQSLWFDEICSVSQASPDLTLGQIFDIYQTDPHPPFHPVVLHYWMKIFGYNEFSPRLLSSLAGIFGIFALFLLGKEVAGKQAGLIAAMITALSSYHLKFSQEVRPYAFAFLFSALSFLFFLKLVKEQNRNNMILYSLFTVLLIYTHYFGLIMLLSHYIALIIYMFIIRFSSQKKLLIHFTLSGLIITVLYSPWIPTVIKMLQKKNHFTKMPKSNFFINYFKAYFGNNSYLTMLFAVVILCLVIYLFLRSNGFQFKTVSIKEPDLTIPFLLFIIFFSLFIPYVRSSLTVPFIFTKYTITTLALFIPLIAAGITLFRGAFFKSFIIISIILVSLFDIVGDKAYYQKIYRQQYREVTQDVIKIHTKNNSFIYFARLPDQYQFYFDLYKSGIKILPADMEHLDRFLNQKNPEGKNICILAAHRGLPVKRFIKAISKKYISYKKIKYYSAKALYYRLKNK